MLVKVRLAFSWVLVLIQELISNVATVASRSFVVCFELHLSLNLSCEHDFKVVMGVRVTREGDLYREMTETGVINLEGDSKVALAFGIDG